jgi:outer membrane receptor for ferrienterochelin and colicin
MRVVNLVVSVCRAFRFGFLILPALVCCHFANAQQVQSEPSISIDVKDIPLEELLNLISSKSGLVFSYNPKRIPVSNRVSYKAVNRNLNGILEDLSQQFGIASAKVENQIILKAEKKTVKPEQQKVTFSGTIKDSDTGEPLIGATIYVKQIPAGTLTNGYGFFSLTMPKGIYEVTFSYIGFKDVTEPLDLTTSALQKDISMKESAPLLDEIVITNTTPDVVTEMRSGTIDFQPKVVSERPALFGEMDVVKSLESVPGIKLHSDGSTFYYVRGGNRDQNLVLVDDAPIYNPSHMLGIFSTIIPDAVNDITIYKGDMPASLGGRLSSVMDIRTKKGNDQHFQAWGNTGLLSTKLGIEGPLKKNVSSYLISTRISTMKWILRASSRDIQKFNFYDFTGKVNSKLNPSNRIYFSFYTGADNYFGTNSGIAWTNSAGSFRWNHLFNSRLFLNTTVAAGGYDYFLYTDVARNARWNSHIANLSIKTDFSYFIRPGNEFTFGMSTTGYNFNPGNLQMQAPVAQRLSLSVKNSTEFVLYGNHEMRLTDRWGVNYGLRLSSWQNTGEAFEFIFDKDRNPTDTLYFKKGENYKKYGNLEPRLTVSYLLSDRSSFKAGWARNVQNVHLISNSVSPFTSLEVWLPSSINIKPQTSRQATIGYYYSALSGISFTTEAFYKKMNNQIDYNAHAETLLNPMLERELRFGTAKAYGIELLAKKDEGRLRGWVGYSYARAKRKFADINNGRTYNAFYDRPHQINLMLSYDLTLRWNVGMNWNYSTGAPFSSPISFYQYNGEEIPVYGQKNNARLPDYHRMDLSATVKLNKNPEKKFRHSISMSVFNFYGRKNPLFINYSKTQTDNGEFRIPSNLLESNRVTSKYFLFRFSPSVTYNFKWL